MKTPFLDYYKTIAEKVSFDRDLLSKEYMKAMKHLESKEANEFDEWLQQQKLHPDLSFRPAVRQSMGR